MFWNIFHESLKQLLDYKMKSKLNWTLTNSREKIQQAMFANLRIFDSLPCLISLRNKLEKKPKLIFLLLEYLQ